MLEDDLPLLAWSPPGPAGCTVLPFPLNRRTGKIRDVASKLHTKRTQRHISQYREQVSAALVGQLHKAGFSDDVWSAEIAAFWRAVESEAARITHRESRSGPGVA